MYIFEIFVKWLNKNKRGDGSNPDNILKEGINLNRDGEKIDYIEDEAATCEHNYMPVDSTGEVLACTKCGYVIKKRSNKKA